MIDRILAKRIVPLVVLDSAEDAEPLAEAAGVVKMLKSLAGPYAHTGVKFTPTGGISTGNLQDYLKLPVVAAIGGSWMCDKGLIADGKWSHITQSTARARVGGGMLSESQ